MNPTESGQTTILLADDHAMVRQGLHALLSSSAKFVIIGEASDGLEALRMVEQLQPDILILDLVIPALDGLEVARQSRRRFPKTQIIILSMHADEAYVIRALNAGAIAYVLKSAESASLVQAIHESLQGRRFLSPPLSIESINAYAAQTQSGTLDLYETLTGREREVLHLAAEGHTNAKIGGRLFISPRTVEVHRAHLMRKISAGNQSELVRFAIKQGILGPSAPPPGS